MSAEDQFNPVKYLYERQKAVSQLEQKLGNVWISPDIALEKPVVVQPDELLYQSNNIILNKKDLPAVDITREALASLDWSVRSFFAQTGIEIMFHPSSLSDEMVKDLNERKNVAVPVNIKNHGERAVEVKGDVMRFFYVNKNKRLRKEKLLQTIKSGEFAIEGVEGKDWYLGGWNIDEKLPINGEGSDQGLCVVVHLKPEKFYIPNASEPVKKDNSKSTRDNLAELLKPIPEGVEPYLKIGETPRIKLGENIIGVINLGAEKGQRHIYSPLIDSGFDGPIRTETVDRLDQLDFFLYRK